MDWETLRAELARTLSPKRLAHTKAVANYAAELAQIWGENVEKAWQAGMLHDMMHYLSDAMYLEYAQRYGLPISAAEQEKPLLLHGPLAACILREEYGCRDEQLLTAIRLHTVPDPQMDRLAKILFIADIAEPTRPPWPGQEEIRALARTDLDAAMVKALERTLVFLQERGKKAHPDTQNILAAFRQKAAQNTGMEVYI